MKNFTFKQPTNLKEAVKIFKVHPQATPFAGGTDLLGLMKDDVFNPQVLVDLKKLPNLDKINYIAGKGLSIGALAKVAHLTTNKTVNQKYKALAQAANAVASPQLRNMGTVAGNLCQRPRCWYFRGDFNCIRKGGDTCFAVDGENKFHCIIGGGPCFIVHPSDTAVALLALNASVNIMAGKKKRNVALKDFFVLPDQDSMNENILKPGEFITEIIVPDASPNMHSKFLKFTERDVWDFATVSGAVVWHGTKDKITSGRLVLGGVAPIPWLEETISNKMSNLILNEKNIDQLATLVLQKAEPMSQNDYKVAMARNLVKQLLY
jgi:xanthine dehydrogenase YagS FAD-binding subunit